MNILYDESGKVWYAVRDAQAATFIHDTALPLSVFHIDEIAPNATLLADLEATVLRRDQNGDDRYRLVGGVLTVRQGWLPFSPALPAGDPNYVTADQPVAMVVVQPKALAKAALTDNADPTRIATRNTARVLMASLVETRAAYNQLAAWARPLGYAGPTLVNRTFAQAVIAAGMSIDAESDPTQ